MKIRLNKKRPLESITMSSARTKRKRKKGMSKTNMGTIESVNKINECRNESASYWNNEQETGNVQCHENSETVLIANPETIEDSNKKSTLIRLIEKITSTECPPTTKLPFIFENTREAAETNSTIIKEHDGDLAEVLKKYGNSIFHPGTEFRKSKDLKPLLQQHKDWQKLKDIIDEGASYAVMEDPEYTDAIKRQDLEATIERGNNKSAKSKESEEFIKKNYDKEVDRAWMLPVTKESITSIKGAGVIPIGVTQQFSIDEKGQRIEKRRLTHDCSHKMPSGHSLNSRIDTELLDECIYGQCLLRILHNIHILRRNHPTKKIYANKTDLDAAFRRIHILLKYALLCITIVGNVGYILSRCPFGVNEGPGKFCIASEITIDLAQEIADDTTWEPEKLRSPHMETIPEIETNFNDGDEFGQAEPLSITMEEKQINIDGFVDDIITITLDIEELTTRAKGAVPLALHTIFRPTSADEPVTRHDVLSLRKMLGEGCLSELKVILGWLVDTRNFLIKLPEDKARTWIKDIDDLIKKKTASIPVKEKELESMIGKLNHACYILKEGKYFMSRLRYRLKICKQHKKSSIKLQMPEHKDLLLWKKFLTVLSEQGRSINHTTFTLPRSFLKSDACYLGLGGFTSEGLAWRYWIPTHLQFRASINVLEFMAIRITIWLALQFLKNIKSGIKIFGQSDNTSAIAWLYSQTLYDDKHSATMKEEIGRAIGNDLIEADASLYSQHIPGKHNEIADQLSRSNLKANDLIKLLQEEYKHKMPQDQFKIVQLPEEITSWIQSVLEKGTRTEALDKERETHKRKQSVNGPSSPLDATSTLSYEMKQQKERIRSLVASRTALEITNLAKQLEFNLEDCTYAPPSAMYQRPSNRKVMKTQR